MKTNTFNFSPSLNHENIYIKNSSKKLVVGLHGFGQNYKYMYRSLKHLDDVDLLCPNAPFALPPNNDTKLGIGFSWYHYNIKKNEYIVSMENSINYLFSLINSLEKLYEEIYFVGFSQGAYLAPFVANKIKNVSKLFLIAGRIKDEDLFDTYPWELIQIHGKEDNIVEYDNSLNSFNNFVKLNKGQFITLDMKHEINAGVVLEIKKHI